MFISTVDSADLSKSMEELNKPSTDRTQLDRDDFMELFVKQLQYQDPMNPMESADMASQMAQFNMVDLMYKSNEAMNKLVEATQERSLMNSVSFIGKEVAYEGNRFELTEEGAPTFKIRPEDNTASTIITIKDERGRVVRSLDIGEIENGEKEFTWDGLNDAGDEMPAGIYTISAIGRDIEGNDVETSVLTRGLVRGLNLSEDGSIKLTMNTEETAELKDVESVFGR